MATATGIFQLHNNASLQSAQRLLEGLIDPKAIRSRRPLTLIGEFDDTLLKRLEQIGFWKTRPRTQVRRPAGAAQPPAKTLRARHHGRQRGKKGGR